MISTGKLEERTNIELTIGKLRQIGRLIADIGTLDPDNEFSFEMGLFAKHCRKLKSRLKVDVRDVNKEVERWEEWDRILAELNGHTPTMPSVRKRFISRLFGVFSNKRNATHPEEKQERQKKTADEKAERLKLLIDWQLRIFVNLHQYDIEFNTFQDTLGDAVNAVG